MLNNFGIRVEELLQEKKITKYRLAQQTGISKSVISDYCKGRVQPTADAIILVASFFDVSTDYLLGVVDESGRKVLSARNQRIEK